MSIEHIDDGLAEDLDLLLVLSVLRGIVSRPEVSLSVRSRLSVFSVSHMAWNFSVVSVMHIVNVSENWLVESVQLFSGFLLVILDTVSILINDLSILLNVDILSGHEYLIANLKESLISNSSSGALDLLGDIVSSNFGREGGGVNVIVSIL